MSAAFGFRYDAGHGLLAEVVNTDLDVDLTVYEFLFTTDGPGQPRELKRVRLTRAQVEDVLFPALDSGALFGLKADLGGGLVLSKTSADGDICVTLYDQLATSTGLGEPEVIKQFTLTELEAAELVNAIREGGISNDLWAFWEMEADDDGAVADSSGNDRAIAITDTVDFDFGKIEKRVRADDDTNDGHLEFAVSPELDLYNTDITLAFWYRTGTDADTASFGLADDEDAANTLFFIANASGAGKIQIQMFNDEATPEPIEIAHDTSGWNFYVIRWNHLSKIADLSINGGEFVPVVAWPTTEGVLRVTTVYIPFIVGVGEHDWDEFGIWLRALNVAEVADLYNGGQGNGYPFDFSRHEER